MNKITTISIMILFLVCPVIQANDDPIILNETLPDLTGIRNPFQPHFFKEPVKIVTPKIMRPKISQPEIENIITPPIDTQQDIVEQPTTEVTEVIVFPAISITGLIWNSSNPQAIINHEVKQTGDKIQQATIINITKTGIIVELNGERKVFTP